MFIFHHLSCGIHSTPCSVLCSCPWQPTCRQARTLAKLNICLAVRGGGNRHPPSSNGLPMKFFRPTSQKLQSAILMKKQYYKSTYVYVCFMNISDQIRSSSTGTNRQCPGGNGGFQKPISFGIGGDQGDPSENSSTKKVHLGR